MYPGGNLVKLAPTVLAAAHTAGDIIFTKQEVQGAVPSRGGCSILRSVSCFVEGVSSDDDLTLLFFDNDTALGEPAGDPMSDVTAAEFLAASCIGMIGLNAANNAVLVSAGTGKLYSNASTNDANSYSGAPLFIKAAEGKTSIWVAMIQPAGTLDMADTDSLSLTLGFEYLG